MSDHPPSVHRIRLAGPWEVESDLEFRNPSRDTEKSCRVKMPASWQEIFGTQCGTAIFRRSFNSPTGLQNQKVFLVISAINCTGQLCLNDQFLGKLDDEIPSTEEEAVFEKRFEITQIIQPRNRINIELTCDPQTHQNCGLCTAITLEIAE